MQQPPLAWSTALGLPAGCGIYVEIMKKFKNEKMVSLIIMNVLYIYSHIYMSMHININIVYYGNKKNTLITKEVMWFNTQNHETYKNTVNCHSTVFSYALWFWVLNHMNFSVKLLSVYLQRCGWLYEGINDNWGQNRGWGQFIRFSSRNHPIYHIYIYIYVYINICIYVFI
jgi:hypothetical protein